jgi:hypothetical protein
MPEEIRIAVSAPGADDAANKMARLKKEAAELRRVGDFREAQGDQAGARFARQDASKIEKELNALTKERAGHEREITRERVKQAAEEKLQGGRTRRIVGAAANFAESQAGATGFGGLTSALGAAGGPAGAIAAAAAAIAMAVGGALVKDRDEREVTTARIGERRAGDRRHARLQSGYRGDSGQATGDVDSSHEEMAQLASQRQRLELEARPGALDPRRWSNALLGTNFQTWSGQRKIAENEEEQKAAREKNDAAKKNQATLFQRDGAVELQMLEARSKGHRAEAWQIERKKKWTDEYNKAMRELGPGMEWAAQEKASLLTHQDDVARAQSMGRSVNARSGAGDVRAAARMAQEFLGGGAVVKELGSLREQLAAQHIDIKSAHPIAKFGPRLPR